MSENPRNQDADVLLNLDIDNLFEELSPALDSNTGESEDPGAVLTDKEEAVPLSPSQAERELPEPERHDQGHQKIPSSGESSFSEENLRKTDRSTRSVRPESSERIGPQRVSVSSPLKKATLVLSHVPTLRGERGEEENRFLAPPDIRDFVLLLSNGKLYVSQDHAQYHKVRYYVGKVSKIFEESTKSQLFRENVPLEELKRLINQYVGRIHVQHIENTEQQRIQRIILEAVHAGATDLHWNVKGSYTTIYSRINGELIRTATLSRKEGEELAGTLYNGMLQTSGVSFKTEDWQEGQWKAELLPAELSNIRESHRPIVGGFAMKLRLQYRRVKSATTLADMGYSEDHLLFLDYMMAQSDGIFLFSGPMGSAKSTSLSLLMAQTKEMNPGLSVVSVEDPPEYDILEVEQSKPPRGNFGEALKRLLRQDADIIMLGEIRDEETGKIAVEVALTGHPIWSTIHAASASAILLRLEEMGINRARIYDPNLFSGLVAQRLLPKLCPVCKIPSRQTDDLVLFRKLESIGEDPENVFVRGKGCGECSMGLKGATLAAEIVIPDVEFMRTGFEGKTHEQMQYWRQELGGQTLLQHALSKMRQGLVSPVSIEESVGLIGADESVPTLMSVAKVRKLMGRVR